MHLTVLPGDGIGPEIVVSTLKVLERLNEVLSLNLSVETHEVGLARLRTDGTTFPSHLLERCRIADGIILGPLANSDFPPRSEGGINISRELRIGLDLYANIRPSRTRDGVRYYGRTPMDLVVVRENTEGFYTDRNMFMGSGEFMPTPDVALAVRKITAGASARIAKAAFELAEQRRAKVTAVHKANVIKMSETLFLGECRKVGSAYPNVAYDEQLVDSMVALLVRSAETFDVIVTTNMFGDILSDEASELAGSLGLAGSLNTSDSHCMAQAAHGCAPDIAGQDKANPSSLLLSAAMMLDWISLKQSRPELKKAASLIDEGIDNLVRDPSRRTRDLGGTLGTMAFTDALCAEIDTLVAAERPTLSTAS